MTSAKLRQVLQLWALALAISAALVAAGQRWSEPLVIRDSLVWGLLLLPSLVMVLVVLGRWSLPAAPDLTLPGQEGESDDSIQEQP
ncbi:MAG: hypothetical protein WCI65_09335 [Synechococcaceae cyanobacterium ELA263]